MAIQIVEETGGSGASQPQPVILADDWGLGTIGRKQISLQQHYRRASPNRCDRFLQITIPRHQND